MFAEKTILGEIENDSAYLIVYWKKIRKGKISRRVLKFPFFLSCHLKIETHETMKKHS
jgi:hypothetical protein